MNDVINNKADRRYELEVEGHLATEHYKLDGNIITFEHTDVPKELGGKGIGSKLVRGALDQVRAKWMGEHPIYHANWRLDRYKCVPGHYEIKGHA